MRVKQGDNWEEIIPKVEEEFTTYEKATAQVNHRALNILYCAIDPSELNKVSTHEIDKGYTTLSLCLIKNKTSHRAYS
mgnify:CR=1 FL=1